MMKTLDLNGNRIVYYLCSMLVDRDFHDKFMTDIRHTDYCFKIMLGVLMADRLEQMIKTIRGVLSFQDKILRDINSLKNKEWQKNLSIAKGYCSKQYLR
ncbi:hypothetical protein [Borrelia coriaceae]|uniref:hypothetical protein n=1 Tax=Borrelia coriaceae TaxID=144 RepID=UPI0012DCEB31|nr:hypothetical protein [Borrelia coriaceae]